MPALVLWSDFTIRASAGSGGTINPNGSVKISLGDDITFFFQPNIGMQIDSVIVDGTDLGRMDSYTFKNFNSAHSISVVFKPLVPP